MKILEEKKATIIRATYKSSRGENGGKELRDYLDERFGFDGYKIVEEHKIGIFSWYATIEAQE